MKDKQMNILWYRFGSKLGEVKKKERGQKVKRGMEMGLLAPVEEIERGFSFILFSQKKIKHLINIQRTPISYRRQKTRNPKTKLV